MTADGAQQPFSRGAATGEMRRRTNPLAREGVRVAVGAFSTG
jgi:hypothetical protein